MTNRIRVKIQKAAFFVNGFVFLVGADAFITSDKTTFAVISGLAAFLNFSCGIWLKPNRERWMNIAANLINAVVAATVAWDYVASGKRYLQYAWLMVTVVYAVVGVMQWIQYRKLSSSKDGTSNSVPPQP